MAKILRKRRLEFGEKIALITCGPRIWIQKYRLCHLDLMLQICKHEIAFSMLPNLRGTKSRTTSRPKTAQHRVIKLYVTNVHLISASNMQNSIKNGH